MTPEHVADETRPRRKRAASSATRKSSGGERVRLRIGNLGKAVLISGQAYQDPKDALNEFVSNAADEYAQAGRTGERIRVLLRRRGASPVIAIDDSGRGLTPDRLREMARNLFESTKVGDDRTLGEKAIGLLAFQQLGGRCDVVSRAEDSAETWALRLRRGDTQAELIREKRRARATPGTTVYLADLDAEVLRVTTQRKVVDYLRRRRGAALARGDYSIEVTEGRTAELVTPEQPEGIRLTIPGRQTLWGRIEFALYVAPDSEKRRGVAVVGRAGTTIIDDLSELEEFDRVPWTSGQVAGQVVFESLQQTAGRRAVLRDDTMFPVFREAIESIEPLVAHTIERVRRQVDEGTAERLSDAVRRIFGKVLKELADLDNPMRTPVDGGNGSSDGLFGPGAGASSSSDSAAHSGGTSGGGSAGARDDGMADPSVDDLAARASAQGNGANPGGGSESGGGDPRRSRHLPSIAVDPEPGEGRSRFDAEEGVVLYNDRHTDYLLVKDDEPVLLDYLATVVAKEYVVYNNPRASSEDLGEEMVRMLIRVRRHTPRRR